MTRLRDTLSAVGHFRGLWFAQLLINPALFALAAWWLTIPEAHAWQLAAAAVLALLVVIAFLLLQSQTLARFLEWHSSGEDPRAPLGMRLLAFACFFVFLLLCLRLVDAWSVQLFAYSSYLRSSAPLWLRRHLSENAADSLLGIWFWLAFWVIVPGLLFPLGAQIGRRGFRGLDGHGWRAWAHAVFSPLYWIGWIALAWLGVYLPRKLIAWVPKLQSLGAQAISMTARFLLAWILCVTAWLVMTSLVGRFSAHRDPRPDSERA
jgi:hypothetical protein